MPVSIAGTPVFHDTVTAPSNTDDATGPSVADPVTQLQDNCKFLRQQVRLRGGHGVITVPLYDGATTAVTLGLAPVGPTADHLPGVKAGSVVQVALAMEGIQTSEVYSFKAMLVLRDPDRDLTLQGPAIGFKTGQPITLVSHFPIAALGDYDIQFRFAPAEVITHTERGYLFNVTAVINEANQ